jgi:pimeloyl-ACP methyl ester carboxylesterase
MLAAAMALTNAFRRAPFDRPLWRELRPAVDLSTGVPYDTDASGPAVLLVPGLMAGDASLHALADGVARHGYRPVMSGIERNVDCSGATVVRLVGRLEEAAAQNGGPVAVIGHSRGGLLARALAHRRPDLVGALVTLGSPHADQLALHPVVLGQVVALGMLGTLGVAGLLRLGCGGGGCCASFNKALAAPLPHEFPYLSLYSRQDGVVDWRACLDPLGRHREVDTTHCGMVASPAVLDHIMTTLAVMPAERNLRLC